MKIINNIDDLKRIYRIKDLLYTNEIEIDFIKMLSNFLGEDYNFIKESFLLKIYNEQLYNVYSKEQLKAITELDSNLASFITYLKTKVSNDIFSYIKETSLYLKEETRYIDFPKLFKLEKSSISISFVGKV